MSDRTADVSEAIWELESRYGLGLSVPDQVAIARAIASSAGGSLTVATVAEAFRSRGVRPPSRSYTEALIARVDALAPRPSLVEVLTNYRRFAIRELSGQFGGRATGHEEELRNNLLTFLPERGYTEARTGRGQTDILLPSPKRIIEVKVWTTLLVYEDGILELGRYIHTEAPVESAYMVVFGDRDPLPLTHLVKDDNQVVAETRTIEGLRVPVVVVPFESVAPSRIGREARKAAKRGR